MATDFSIHFNFSPCLHRHIVTVITGGMHFSEGVVWDDICESILCLDCMEYLTEAEVRARWNGTETGDASIASQEDEDVTP